MNFDFEAYLANKLSAIAVELNFVDDEGKPDPVNILISEEQNFANMNKLEPNNIYVVIKYLSSDIQYYTETMPIQILVLSEQNSLDKAKMILNKFANENNWQVLVEDGTTYIKQQYNSPVVLNNYVELGYGYRSVLYVTGTLFILDNVMDVKDLTVKINGVNEGNPIDIQLISSTIGYSMQGDTQPFGSGHAKTVKNFSTFVMTITVPSVKTPFTQRCVEIMKATSPGKGNETFTFSFLIGDIEFEDVDMKLSSSTLTTAINNVPALQLSFSV